jgi:DNA-binding beta-propeller fold protein YncE
MLIANDEKITWDEAGRLVLSAPGRDAVSLVDIGRDPESPRIVATLPLMNVVFGPPTNVAITPDRRLGLVANSMDWAQEGGAWKGAPGTTIHVIDLTLDPPAAIGTVAAGRQASSIAINPAGTLALVANRADNSVSVFAIRAKEVRLVETLPMGEHGAAVTFTPDGRRALVMKFTGHNVAFLDVSGEKVAYSKHDVPTGQFPYNVAVTPDGRLALTADTGNNGASDGHIDTVTVIDLEAQPPRASDRVVVGDAPEGLAISPRGYLAVAELLRGSNVARNSWFYNKSGSLVLLAIQGKRVTRVGEVEVGGLPEGVVFSADGRYLYVGNYLDRDVWILKGGRAPGHRHGQAAPPARQLAAMRGPRP